MSLVFIHPRDAIRAIAESIGKEARRQLVAEVIRGWIDDLPETELAVQYERTLEDLDEQDLSMLAAWHASMEVGQPIANREFLMQVFPSLGESKREALKIAAGFRGEDAFEAGVGEEQALEAILPFLADERAVEIAAEAVELYCWDRLGAEC